MKPTVEYFRVFGCLAHVHVPDQRRIKLDDKSILCVLLGVSDESKAYRLFDPVSKKIIVSRDVVFEETKGWNWDMSREEIISDVLEWGDPEEEIDGAQNAQKLGQRIMRMKKQVQLGSLEQMPTRMKRPSSRA
jgi:hypothetical protein